jgi:ribosome biogenesis GTPase A
MADKEKVDNWIKYFKKDNTRCITLDSTASGSGKKVEYAIRDVLKSKIDKFKEKNMNP